MTLIVCERTGDWAAALRRFAGPLAAIRETRSLAECRCELASGEVVLVAIELTERNLDVAIEFLTELDAWPRRVAAVALAGESLAIYEPLAREAGAIDFVWRLRDAPRVAALHARRAIRLPSPRRSLAEQLWSAIPWGVEEGVRDRGSGIREE